MATLEARAVITATDDTGRAFASVETKIKGLEKCIGGVAKAIDTVEKVAHAVAPISQKINSAAEAVLRTTTATRGLVEEEQRLRTAAGNLGVYKSMNAAFEKTEQALMRAREQMRGAWNEIAASAAPTKEMRESFRNVEIALKRTNDEFEIQKFHLERARAACEEFIGPLDSVASAEARLAEEVQRVNRELAEQGHVAGRASEQLAASVRAEEKSQQRRAAAIKHFTSEMLPWAGPAILHGTLDAAKAGAELEHSKVEALKSGMPPAELNSILDKALELSVKYGNVTQGSLVDTAKELRSVVTKPEEALQILDSIAAAQSILNARGKGEHVGESLIPLVKGAENIGAAKDPQRLIKLIDGWVRAMQVMGTTISPETIFDFAKRSKSAGASLSDRFLMTTAQSLSQEMGGEQAGNAASQLYKQLAGGFQNSHGALKEFVRLGLLDPGDVDYLKSGEAKGLKPGHQPKWLGHAASDPDQFVWDTIVPALVKGGYTTAAQQLPEIRKLFPNSSEADLVTKLVVQMDQYQAHAKLYDAGTGLGGTAMNRDDPLAQLKAIEDQLQTFAGVLTSPIMKDAAHGLAMIADAFGALATKLAEFDKANPLFAKLLAGGAIGGGLAGGGYLTGKLFGGFASLMGGGELKGSATALGLSAQALERAAVALGGKGVLPGGAPGETPSGAPKPGIGMFAAFLRGPGLLIAMKIYEDQIKEYGVNPLLEAIFGKPTKTAAPPTVGSVLSGGWDWLTKPRDVVANKVALDPVEIAQLVDRNRRDRQRGDATQSPEARRGAAMHELAQRDLKVTLDPASKAEIAVTVTVNAASSLISAAATATAKAGGNLSAAVGVSSAGVAPNAPTRWDR